MEYQKLANLLDKEVTLSASNHLNLEKDIELK